MLAQGYQVKDTKGMQLAVQARTRLAFPLCLRDVEHCHMLCSSQPAFSGCTNLQLEPYTAAAAELLPPVAEFAGTHFTRLQRVQIDTWRRRDDCTPAL